MKNDRIDANTKIFIVIVFGTFFFLCHQFISIEKLIRMNKTHHKNQYKYEFLHNQSHTTVKILEIFGSKYCEKKVGES